MLKKKARLQRLLLGRRVINRSAREAHRQSYENSTSGCAAVRHLTQHIEELDG